MKSTSIISKIKINIKYDILDMYINFGKYEKKKMFATGDLCQNEARGLTNFPSPIHYH